MGIETILLIAAIGVGFYMAWNIGANDVANAMGTSVGSGALTLRRAVVLAAVFEFAGAFLVGANVTETVQKKIVDPGVFAADPMLWVYGMLAALLAAGVWLQLASYFGWPISTTHSIIGALFGFGVIVGGSEAIYWSKVTSIAASWVLSPFLGGLAAFLVFNILRQKIFYARHPVEATKRLLPYLVFCAVSMVALVVFFKGLKNINIDLDWRLSLLIAMATGGIGAFITHYACQHAPSLTDAAPEEVETREHPQVTVGLRKALKHLRRAHATIEGEERQKISDLIIETENLATVYKKRVIPVEHASDYRLVEKMFGYLQILSACSLAFAHGANDVANAIGPLAAAVHVLHDGDLTMGQGVPIWILLLGGSGIVIGLATWGWRVIETVGRRITELTPSRGFSAEFGAAVVIVLASKMGLPISTTHTLVGAVIGVGLARGLQAVNLNLLRDIAISWLITIPAGAGLAIVFYYSLLGIFG